MKSSLNLLFLKPQFVKPVLGGITGTFFFKLFDVIPDILLGFMIDIAIRREHSFLIQNHFVKEQSTIFLIGIAALLIWLISNLFHFLSIMQWKRAGSVLQFLLRMELCRYLLTDPKKQSPRENSTLRDDARSINRNIDILEFFVSSTLEEFFRLLFAALIIGPILFIIAPFFLLYAVLSLFPIFLFSILLQKKLRLLYETARKKLKILYREIDELVDGISVIKDFGVEKRFYKKIELKAEELRNSSNNAGYISSAAIPCTRVFIQIGLVGILIHGAFLIYNAQIPFGAFAAASFLSRKFLLPFSFLGGLIDRLVKGYDCVKEISLKLSSQNMLLLKDSNPVKEPLESIQLKGINYYHGSKKILHDINVSFMPEQINIIKGPTGSGKTTLLRLLMRDFSFHSGEILNSYKDISFVPQYPKLFNASILDNITLFDAGYNSATLEKALSVSLVTQFINQFPNGIHSIVGLNGIKLSGGQMQSIAIARAFYSDAKIFLLDEPTASFDEEREKLFLAVLRQNLKGRLIIMTSHRARSIKAADFLYEIGRQ